MCDSWEDWENDDYDVPVLNVLTTEQLKRLEEQKLIEESDIELAKDLIGNNKKDEAKRLTYEEINCLEKPYIQNNSIATISKKNPKSTLNKKKENEEKQKIASKKLKEEKAKREKERELFGDAYYDDEYAEDEDKFYENILHLKT